MKKSAAGKANRINKKQLILPLFILTLLAVNLVMVSAADFVGGAGDTLKNFFTNWTDATIGANTAKIMFGVMIAVILFLVLYNVAGQSGSKFMVPILILSAVVAFLVTAYITPPEIYALLNSYTATGMTIIAIVPLAIIGLFSWQAATSGKPTIMIIQWLLWGFYFLFLVYKIVVNWGEGSGPVNIIVGIGALVALIMVIFNKQIVAMIGKKYIEAETDAAGNMVTEVWDIRKKERDAARKAVN